MLSIEEINNLDKNNKELKNKLNHIKMVSYGSYREIKKQLKEYFDKNETVSTYDILQIIENEVEKTNNLCLMCNAIKYEHALESIDNLIKGYYSEYAEKIRSIISEVKG